MSRRFLYLFVLVALAACLGCSLSASGDGGGGEIGLIDFGADPTPEPFEVVSARVGVSPEVLVEVNYLYSLQVGWEGLRRANRDLQALVDYSSPGEVGVEWVVDVHDVTLDADQLFGRLTSMGVPPSQRAQYEDNYLDMLEAVRITGFGADRILAAALGVGPTGRTLGTMSDSEVEEFLVLTREATFYLQDAEKSIEKGLERVSEALSRVGLR